MTSNVIVHAAILRLKHQIKSKTTEIRGIKSERRRMLRAARNQRSKARLAKIEFNGPQEKVHQDAANHLMSTAGWLRDARLTEKVSARTQLLAYGFLRGRKYRQMEPKTEKEFPRTEIVELLKALYVRNMEDKLKRWASEKSKVKKAA